jgi:hypothetical protein
MMSTANIPIRLPAVPLTLPSPRVALATELYEDRMSPSVMQEKSQKTSQSQPYAASLAKGSFPGTLAVSAGLVYALFQTSALTLLALSGGVSVGAFSFRETE